MKECSSCKTSKTLESFNKRRASNDGLSPICKECKAQASRTYYLPNKDTYIEKAKAWGTANPERRKEIERRYRKTHRQQQNLRTTNYRARKRRASMGWDADIGWWNALLDKFDSRCAYCRKAGKMTLDHIHPIARGGLHDPSNIVPACETCNYTKRDKTVAELGWAVYEPNDYRTLAKSIMSQKRGMCYQGAIREAITQIDGVPSETPISMDGAFVSPVEYDQAKEIIHKYEWLGTMGRPQAIYGLWLPLNGKPELAGVVSFGFGTGRMSGAVCGEQHIQSAICLERGVCVHWAPRNAASWFIPRAVAMALREHGWTIFYAYSDPDAGEIGTIYQACNWIYLGIGPGHGPSRERWVRPDGVAVSSRALRARKWTTAKALESGWIKEIVPARAKYVWFEGSPTYKKRMKKQLVHVPQPYPKRESHL
jgi:5-methylcytosine-specific restriction endonuclease McrA